MDSLQKWHAHVVDLKTLFSHWEELRAARSPMTNRSREILTTCLFALCVENNENKRFLVGFPQLGPGSQPAPLRELFRDGFGEIDDWDVLLVPDLGPDDLSEREIHQCQIVGYRNRSGGTDDLIAFLEEKKLRVPRDDDLRLIVHLEQATAFDWVRLSIYLQMRRPRCPYSQVFLLAETVREGEPRWSCRQLYPVMIPLRDLDLQSARAVLADRRMITHLEQRQHHTRDAEQNHALDAQEDARK